MLAVLVLAVRATCEELASVARSSCLPQSLGYFLQSEMRQQLVRYSVHSASSSLRPTARSLQVPEPQPLCLSLS